MQIGKYDVRMIDTGRYRLDGGAMFGVVPQTLWKKEFPPDDKNRIRMALNTLLLVGNGRVILIDTGVGEKFSKKFAEIYAIDHSEHTLLKSLAAYNIQPEDVTDVIITHLHFDHVGGTTYYDESGKLKLQFSNATHYVQKRQLEWANKRFEKDRASYLLENIEPLEKSKNLKIIDGPQKLFNGVDILISDGHTVAQQLVFIYSEDKKLLYAADLIPTSAHVPIPWVMAYDLAPATTIEEKKKLLKQATNEYWMIFFEHDPNVYCATVEEKDRGYRIKNPVIL